MRRRVLLRNPSLGRLSSSRHMLLVGHMYARSLSVALPLRRYNNSDYTRHPSSSFCTHDAPTILPSSSKKNPKAQIQASWDLRPKKKKKLRKIETTSKWKHQKSLTFFPKFQNSKPSREKILVRNSQAREIYHETHGWHVFHTLNGRVEPTRRPREGKSHQALVWFVQLLGIIQTSKPTSPSKRQKARSSAIPGQTTAKMLRIFCFSHTTPHCKLIYKPTKPNQ